MPQVTSLRLPALSADEHSAPRRANESPLPPSPTCPRSAGTSMSLRMCNAFTSTSMRDLCKDFLVSLPQPDTLLSLRPLWTWCGDTVIVARSSERRSNALAAHACKPCCRPGASARPVRNSAALVPRRTSASRRSVPILCVRASMFALPCYRIKLTSAAGRLLLLEEPGPLSSRTFCARSQGKAADLSRL